jgi:exodeoxyribonuclease III
MKLISWNVNGIRACYKKGFVEFIEREQPDILAVQETKAQPDQCEPILRSPAERTSFWSSAKKKGYSGTATFLAPGQTPPKAVRYGIGIDEYDSEGRFVITEHEAFTLYNVYIVNGGSGPERHDFKQRFLKDFTNHLRPLVEAGAPIIITGDFNVAHRPVDVYSPESLAHESGFLPEERQWFDEFLKMGFVDSFRHMHPDARERYTWWAYYERARIGNRGWRIDYFCVTKNLASKITRAEILDGQEGSDHCPVVLELAL